MNKTIRKIVAFGMGAGMLLGTAGAALAATYDLSSYPEPFVKNGAFVGKIVLGEKTGVADVFGALDISASLQRAASTSAGTSGGGTTATAEDGYKFSESEELIFGENLESVNPTVDDTDLPDLLASGIVEADDGTEYEYDVEIQLPAASTAVVAANVNQHDLDDEYTDPVVYFDLGNGADQSLYHVVVDFDDTWSLNKDADDDTGINEGSTTIELFGRAYTFDPNDVQGDQYMTLYGSDTTLLVGKGETKTITYNGKEYSVEVLGGNSDQSTAIIRIGSDTRTVKEGDSKTIGGLPIYVKDVFVSNIGGDDVSVQLFLGSNKIEIEWADDASGEVKLNGQVVDSVAVDVTDGGVDEWLDVQTLTFIVTPSDDDVDYILPGGEYTDPLFGSFKFSFVGAEDLMEGKEGLHFEQSSKKLNVVFTPAGASEPTTLMLLEEGALYEDFFGGATLTNLQEEDMFLYTEDDGDADKAVTHLLQVTRVKDGNDQTSDDYEVVVKDLSFDKTYTVTKCKVLATGIDLYPEQTTDEDNVTFTAETDCGGTDVINKPTIYTDAGVELQFWQNDTDEIDDVTDIQLDNGFFWIDEDAQDDDDSTASTTFIVEYDYDTGDDAYSITVNDEGTATAGIGNDDNKEFYLSEFGTYIVEDADEAPFKYVKLYVPDKEVTYDMFLLPVSSEVTVTSTTSGGAVVLNPIAVGMAIMDSEATLGSKPYIVMGGPCANTVAAELMGNPADCAAGFSEGKGMIKLFAAQNAVLVAGYNAKDTQGASRVLAYYKDYKSKFTGTELEVITTVLSDLKVNSVN